MSIKKLFLLNLMFFLIACTYYESSAQTLNYENKITVVLNDGTQVTCYGRDKGRTSGYQGNVSRPSGREGSAKINAKVRDKSFTGEYYYLPTNLRLSKKLNGTPEFLFMKYTTEERADAGGVQGAIMHFLMEWGLSPTQEKELQTKLKSQLEKLNESPGSPFANIKPDGIRVLGAVDVYNDDTESFRVISATLSDKPESIVKGKAPVIAGTKVAVASKMDKNDAQLLAASFEKANSISDLSLELSYKYNVMMPSVDGQIIIDWTKVKHFTDSLSVQRDSWLWDNKDGVDGPEGVIKDTTARKIYEELIDSKAVLIEIDKMTTDDETANMVVQEFMNVFMEALSERDMDVPPSKETSSEIKEEDYLTDVSYRIQRTKLEDRFKQQIQVYNLKYRIAVPKYMTLTANLASWYNKVKDNENCVTSVNLNDPFFLHRDINLILDLEAEEMFGEEVNYVTVNVRKRRSVGNNYEDSRTIDREYLKKNGVKATMTYARMEDRKSDAYDYKMQWSLKGGKIYPENPRWIKGDWQGVTLATPITPRNIEFEANLDELQELGITRATLQLRFMKFDNEHEVNIPLTVSKGEPLVEKTIYVDRDQQGYAYRLILTHKEKGKLALDWDAKINDDYVYATIPRKFKDGDKIFFEKIKKAAEVIARPGSDGKVGKANSILEKFRDVLDVIVD